MDVPDFSKAEYLPPVAPAPPPMGAGPVDQRLLLRSLGPGVIAAGIGCVIYAVVGRWLQLGIVSILVGGMVGSSMMKATNGVSGRAFQWLAVVLTYFAVTLASTADLVWARSRAGADLSIYIPHHWLFLVVYTLTGPLFEMQLSIAYGALGLLILFFGLQAAWRTAKGGPQIVQPAQTQDGTTLGLR